MDKILRSSPVAGSRRLSYRPASVKAQNSASHKVADPGQDADGNAPVLNGERADNPLEAESTRQLVAMQRKLDELSREKESLERRLADNERQLKEATQETYDDAKAKGYAAGVEEGRTQSQKEIEEALDQFGELLKSIQVQTDNAFSQLESISTDIGFAVVCKILGEKLITREAVLASANAVLGAIRDASHLKVYLSKRDYALLSQVVDGELAGGSGKVELVIDPRINIGGCRVEANTGSWDGRLESQLRILRQKLEELSDSEKS
ncbi:putative flagellar assembly protein [Hahella chejuensis KCTC 2396]|uniref:Flagellar assembly protein FliH n=1 Tax=Hahella chejuensis (strain KCTC 2396) TaxID=349521 RepID=Q2SEY5_HAHCH|nr:FliH/SctL family protein [Hahella chejuensis]ABC30789.1 putative flagellar assembly protein [Hahella chejuensis KCTC 2396]